MDIKSIIEKREIYMENSPIKKAMYCEKLPYKNYILGCLKDISENFDIIKEKLNNPLKVVLMGEVKAGKSSLINLAIGQDISPTDSLEATAAIFEIYYSKNEIGKIILKDKTIKGSIKEIKKILKDNHRNLDFFKECEVIKIGLPIENLKNYHIIDTPGLATVTEANEKTTIEYIKKSDVVLWIFNSTHLGQEDIENAIDKVYDAGKPIIGVLNRIDLISADVSEVIRYAENEYSVYIDEFFPLSCFKAEKAIKEKDSFLLEESGINDLLIYITENIERNSDEVQEESIKNSIESLFSKNNKYHEDYKQMLQKIEDSRIEHKEKLDLLEIEINNRMKTKIDHWYNNEFLSEELEECRKDKNKLNIYLNESYIKSVISKVVNEWYEFFISEWKNEISNIEEEIGKKLIKDLGDNELYINYLSNITNKTNNGLAIAENVGKGALLGGVGAAAIASYVAVLGPAASVITFGAAAGAWFPPLLLAGAAIGLVSTILMKKNSNGDFINFQINKSKEIVYSKVIIKFGDNIATESRRIKSEAQNRYESGELSGLKGDELKGLIKELELYLMQSNSF